MMHAFSKFQGKPYQIYHKCQELSLKKNGVIHHERYSN